MLERVALRQTRFHAPGLVPDGRGVALGERGVLLFSTLDRLVAFVRAYAATGSLDELVPQLTIERVVTPLQTRELVVSFASESSYRMDRVAELARLVGALLFTGTARHFVKYRDASAPLGYDLAELTEVEGDFVLHHDTFSQAYRRERAVTLRELLLKLTPERVPSRRDVAPTRAFVSVEPGLGPAVLRHLFRAGADARVADVVFPKASAFDTAPRVLRVFDVATMPTRVGALLSSLPGVRLFVPLTERVAVEWGHRHPVALDACGSVFASDELVLIAGDGRVDVVTPLPTFVPVESLVTPRVRELAVSAAGPAADALDVSIPLRVVETLDPPRAVLATIVSASEGAWLARLLYALPTQTLERTRIAIAGDDIFLVCEDGIDTLPIGAFHERVADQVFVPAGTRLVPALPKRVLLDLLTARGEGTVFFSRDGVARVVPRDGWSSLSTHVVREVALRFLKADPLGEDDRSLASFEYGDDSSWPLRRVVTDAGDPT